MPISVYKSDHTGPNTHSGGVRSGFVKTSYQTVAPTIANLEPTNPTKCGATRDATNLKEFGNFTIFSF